MLQESILNPLSLFLCITVTKLELVAASLLWSKCLLHHRCSDTKGALWKKKTPIDCLLLV